MKFLNKGKARLIALVILIACVICAVFAYVAINTKDNFTAETEDTVTEEISAPDLQVKSTASSTTDAQGRKIIPIPYFGDPEIYWADAGGTDFYIWNCYPDLDVQLPSGFYVETDDIIDGWCINYYTPDTVYSGTYDFKFWLPDDGYVWEDGTTGVKTLVWKLLDRVYYGRFDIPKLPKPLYIKASTTTQYIPLGVRLPASEISLSAPQGFSTDGSNLIVTKDAQVTSNNTYITLSFWFRDSMQACFSDGSDTQDFVVYVLSATDYDKSYVDSVNLGKTTSTYSTSSQQVTVSGMAGVSSYNLPTGWTISGSTLTIPANTVPNTYNLTFNSSKKFPDGSNSMTLQYTVTKGYQYNIASISGLDQLAYGNTTTLTAQGQGSFTWSIMTLGGDGKFTTSTTSQSVTLQGTGVGQVKISVTASGNNLYDPSTIDKTITIIRKAIPVPTLSKGTGVHASATVSGQTATTYYNAQDQHFTISSTSYVTFSSPTSGSTRSGSDFYAREVKTSYTLRVYVDSNHCWGSTDGGSDISYKTLTLDIKKATPVANASVVPGDFYIGNKLSTVGITGTADVSGSFSWTNGNLELTASNTYGWTFRPTDTTHYNNVTGTLTVTAQPALDKITVSGGKKDYKAYESFSRSGLVVTAHTGTSTKTVTTYTVTVPYDTDERDYFLVSDNGSKVIISYTEGKKTVTAEITVTVVKADYTIPAGTFADKTVPYTGSEQSLTVDESKLPAGVSVTGYKYDGAVATGATNVGEYEVEAVVSITDTDNYNVPTLTATFTIERATPTITTTGMTTTYTYTGSEQTVTGGATVNNTEQTVKYKDNTFTTVAQGNNKKVTVYVEESDNYKALEVEVTITVNKADLNLTWDGEGGEYTGSAYEASIKVTGGVLGTDAINDETLAGGVTITYTGDNGETSPIKVGTYTPVLSVFPSAEPYCNYEVVITNPTFTITVTGAEVTDITFEDGSFEYDGKVHKIEISGTLPDEVKVEYVYKGTTNKFEGVSLVKRNGELVEGYEVTAKFSCATGNFEVPDDITATITITPKEITATDVTGINNEYVYNGKAQKPEPTVSVTLNGATVATTLGNPDDYGVTYSTETPDAGTQVTVTVEGKGNFGGKVTITFTIKKATLGVEWTKGTYTYNGQGQGHTATFTGVAEKDLDTVIPTLKYIGANYPESQDKPVNAGTYTVVVSLDASFNNYESFTAMVESFKIEKATPTVNYEIASHDPEKLYVDTALPNIILVSAISNGSSVAGGLDWALQNGIKPILKLNENSYTWEFIPEDTDNYNVATGTYKFTGKQPNLKGIQLSWAEGTQPTLYTSTTISTVKESLVLTGIRDNDSTYTIEGGYELICSWGPEATPSENETATYAFIVRYGGLEDKSLNSVLYLKVELDGITVLPAVEGGAIKTNYKAYDKFDVSSIKVVAVYNDGNEVILPIKTADNGVADGYGLTYINSDKDYLRTGDNSVTVSYEGESYTIGGLTVNAKTYDVSGITLDGGSVTYDGKCKATELKGYDDKTLKLTYGYLRKDGADWVQVSKQELTEVGEYRVVVKLDFISDEDAYNYLPLLDKTADIKITLATYEINLTDSFTADYDYGNSLSGIIQLEGLPVKYSFGEIKETTSGNSISSIDEIKNAGTYDITVKFENDKNHYAVADKHITLTVNKLKPTVDPKPSGNFAQGSKLFNVLFEAGENDIRGKYEWKNDEYELKAGVNRCTYVFIPEDSVNYETVTGYMDITVTGNGAGLSSGALIGIIVACVIIAFLVAILALVLALRSKRSGDSDGFYDEVTEEDLA